MTKSTTPTDPRRDLENIPNEARTLFTNVHALRELKGGFERDLVFLAGNTNAIGGSIGHVGNAKGSILRLVQSGVADLAAVTVALIALENSAEFKAADATITPLLAAIAQLEAEEQAARQVAADKERELREAVAKAEAAALNDPSVLKARQALAAIAA